MRARAKLNFSKSSSHYYLCFLPPHSSNPSRYGTSFYRWIMWLHNAMSYGLWERCEANQSVEQTRWLLIESRKLKKASLHVWRQHQSDQRSNRTWFDILQKSINRQIEELLLPEDRMSQKCYWKIIYCVNLGRRFILSSNYPFHALPFEAWE